MCHGLAILETEIELTAWLPEKLEAGRLARRLIEELVDSGLGAVRNTVVGERLDNRHRAVITHDGIELGLDPQGTVGVEPVEDIDVGR